MKKRQNNPAFFPALRVALFVALASFAAISFASTLRAVGLSVSERDGDGSPGLRYDAQPAEVPQGTSPVTVLLPFDTVDNSVPIETVFLEPVATTNLDSSLGYIGFQGDFTFDETVITFSPPFVEAAGLTAAGWDVSANILPGPGPIRTLRVSATSVDGVTPLDGAGLLYNLRMLRVSDTPATATALTWRSKPNGFIYIDENLTEVKPNQVNGLMIITGPGPTATPTPIPTPTPCGPISEEFVNIFNLGENNWVLRNHSQPIGEMSWFQGQAVVFPAHSGASDSYIAVSSEAGSGTATLSDWLLTPVLELRNGAQLTFFTRTIAIRTHPDRLQVRMSTSGTSTNVGATATSVGDFTSLLLDINPTYTMSGYPNLWTQFTVVVSGLESPMIGRLAFRYFVENGGPDGANSSYIGIDTFRYTNCNEPIPTPTPATPTPTPGEVCPPVITQSTSQTVPVGNSIACASGPPSHYHEDNSYWRAFNMWPLTGGQSYNVTSVSFGIETARANPLVGTQPVVLRLHAQTTGEFPGGTWTQLASVALDLADQTETVLNVPLSVTVPAGTTQLIMEVFTPSGQPPVNNAFFIGSNAEPQTGASYLSSQACEYPEPTDLALLGFSNMHLVFNINGACPSSTPTPPPTVTPAPRAHAINISTRMRVGAGNNVAIGGFIINGTTPLQVLVRALGPSLTQFGVLDPLADPVLELHGPGEFSTVINDNWRDAQETEIIATGIPPTDDQESAILATLYPGAYTAILTSNGARTGAGLVEIYDLSNEPSLKLANLSTRAFVNVGNNIVIAGLILGGGSADAFVSVRALGPSLSQSGVTNVLADPTLELRNDNGAVVASNDNWQNGSPVTFPPNDPLESAIEMALPPGGYTALLSGVNAGTGVGLIEVYDRGAP